MPDDKDFPAAQSTGSLPDPHGQAALVLVEALLHGLLDQSVLTLAKAVEIVESAIEVQGDVAEAADGSANAMWQSHSILVAICASLKRDMDAFDRKPNGGPDERPDQP